MTRHLSQQTADRLIADAERDGQTALAANLRRVWREHRARRGEDDPELVPDLLATIDALRSENAVLRKRLAKLEARQ